MRVTIVYDSRGNVHAFRRDDVINPFFRGWLSLTPTDDVMLYSRRNDVIRSVMARCGS